jgi:hypothetical protein
VFNKLFPVCANCASEFVADSAVEFPANQIIKNDDLITTPYQMYIPLNIRLAGIYPSYLKGYSAVFGAIAIVLVKFFLRFSFPSLNIL